MRNSTVWLWLTMPIAILLALAAGSGVFVGGLYQDNPSLVAQAFGQDLVSLVVVLPVLLITAFLAGRGSFRARLVWLGCLVYLVYSYLTYAFDLNFNSLFLVYVALLGCSLYALIGGLLTTNVAAVKASFTEKSPFTAVGIYLLVFAALIYLAWLSEIVPALAAGELPQTMQDKGAATNAVYVLDMAWVLPALVITAVGLWRKQTLAYTLAGTLLSYLVLMILAILGMAVFQVRGGDAGAIPMGAMFGTLFAASFGMLLWYMKGLQSPRAASDKPLLAPSA